MMMTSNPTPEPFNGLRIPPPPEKWLDALLVQSDGQFVRERDIATKLRRIGVNVVRAVEPEHATADMMRSAEIVVVAMTQLKTNDSKRVEALAEQANARIFFLQHQTSTPNWQRLADHVRQFGHREVAAAPASEIRMADQAPKSTKAADPTTSALVAQTQDDAALAALYAKEAEEARVRLALVERKRDELALEVSRLTNLLASEKAARSRGTNLQLEEQLSTARKQLEEAKTRAETAEDQLHELELKTMDSRTRIKALEKSLAEREEALSRTDTIDALTDIMRRHADRSAGFERMLQETVGATTALGGEVARLRGMLLALTSLQGAADASAPRLGSPTPHTIDVPVSTLPVTPEQSAPVLMAEPITNRDRVLSFYQQWYAVRDQAPTALDIARHTGIKSPKSAGNSVTLLRKTGLLGGDKFRTRLTPRGFAEAEKRHVELAVPIAPLSPTAQAAEAEKTRAVTAIETRVLVTLYRFFKKFGFTPPTEQIGPLAKLKKKHSAPNALRRARKKGLITGVRNHAVLTAKGTQYVEEYLEAKRAAVSEAAPPAPAPAPTGPTEVIQILPGIIKGGSRQRVHPNSLRVRILNYILLHPDSTNDEIAKAFKIERRSAMGLVASLKGTGDVRASNERKPYTWRATKQK